MLCLAIWCSFSLILIRCCCCCCYCCCLQYPPDLFRKGPVGLAKVRWVLLPPPTHPNLLSCLRVLMDSSSSSSSSQVVVVVVVKVMVCRYVAFLKTSHGNHHHAHPNQPQTFVWLIFLKIPVGLSWFLCELEVRGGGDRTRTEAKGRESFLHTELYIYTYTCKYVPVHVRECV